MVVVNALDYDQIRMEKVEEVKTPLNQVFKALVRADMLRPMLTDSVFGKEKYDPTNACEFDKEMVGHSIQECVAFRSELQKSTDLSQIEFHE
ncbi:hypothetical protein REPUB_Repub07fG0066500 [Reevesia pubescens]